MKNTINNQNGFTLVELILVVAILGLLAAAVAPSFSNLLAKSAETTGKGTAGAIQSGINTKYAENVANNVTPSWPTQLDSAANGACTSSNSCFSDVVQSLSSESWSKTGTTTYQYNAQGAIQLYSYDTVKGTFTCTSGC